MNILTICGSPRKGNSEAIALKLQKLFQQKNVKNEIILLREKHIELCKGCVEYCGLPVAVTKSFRSNSELKGRFNDIFENKKNPKLLGDLQEITNALIN